jgi:exopolyphosphatase / guanosine-5'-triphosphate,3'-diphosphate pyrophosphatase
MRAAVLDLGSNSFHVLVADLDGRTVAPVLREREMLHLGRVVAEHGHVPDEHVERSVATVAHLTELARRSGAQETLAVATAALRDAANGAQVIAALSAAAATPIRVLGGLEEARIGYIGVRASVAVRSEPVLVLDLGGGSLEFATGVGDRVTWSASTPLGASAMSAGLGSDALRKRDRKALHARVDAALDPLVDMIRAQSVGTTIAVGGTVRALARVLAARAATWLPATVNQFEIRTDDLDELAVELAGLDLDARADIPGMKERRADHIHVAAIVLARALRRLGTRSFTVSDWGLREGLLLDAHGVSTPPTAVELRTDEIERLRTAFVPDDPHPPHVEHLAGQLFDGTAALHELGPADRELLGHAARVHAIGEAIALRKQHFHGAYLVDNAELRGFSPTDSAMLTTLVRFHRSRGINRSFDAFAALGEKDRDRVTRLLALLQVADGLDRAHDQAVSDLDVEVTDDRLVLTLQGRGLHVTTDELERKTQLFTRTFDRDVAIVDHGHDALAPDVVSVP